MPDARTPRTSKSHPLRIDAVQARPDWGLIGMSLCPGKQQVDGLSGHWQRDIDMDLARIQAWGASIVVSLVEPHEFAELGVEALPAEALRLGMGWRHLPIPDQHPPGEDFERRWAEVGAELVIALREGRRIFLHCKGGLGRTGTVAACLLREAGVGAAKAVAQVRLARPKTIETAEQKRYVQAYTRRFGGGL
ncbi:MAG: phosphatase [Zoogloea sp.]|nr:MAG: phosphatase [Zoogloea sp.]